MKLISSSSSNAEFNEFCQSECSAIYNLLKERWSVPENKDAKSEDYSRAMLAMICGLLRVFSIDCADKDSLVDLLREMVRDCEEDKFENWLKQQLA